MKQYGMLSVAGTDKSHQTSLSIHLTRLRLIFLLAAFNLWTVVIMKSFVRRRISLASSDLMFAGLKGMR